MNRNCLLLPLSLLALLTVSCTSNKRVELDGIPAFFAEGAKISGEPEPAPPDNTFLEFADDSGPFEITYITDKRRYPSPPEKKVKKVNTLRDPLERGREYRIKRLFR